MTHSRPVAVLDANVLYPARLRDLLLRLAIAGHYQARWSDRILDECFHNLIVNRPDLNADRIERTRTLMNVAVPDALVTDYAHHVEQLALPDPDDRHVLAAAIEAGATLIVTHNLDDFPAATLIGHGIEAIDTDEFVHRLIVDDIDAVAEIIDQQAMSLRNPPMTTVELLNGLAAVGLTRTVDVLRAREP